MFIVVVFMFNVFEMEEYWYLIFILIELLMFDYVWNRRKKNWCLIVANIGSIWQFFKSKK